MKILLNPLFGLLRKISDIQSTPDSSNLQGKSKRLRVIAIWSYRGMGFLLTPLITSHILTHFVYHNTRKLKKMTQRTQPTLNTSAAQFFELWKFSVLEYVLSHYTLTNEVRVIEGKIIKKMTWSQGIRNSLRVSGRFELSRVRVTEGKISVNVWSKPRGNQFWFK